MKAYPRPVSPEYPARQRGAALAISLIFLLILTLLGITAMSGSTVQERLAGNQRDLELAFEAAEAALRDGENNILGFGAPPTPVGASCTGAATCTVWDYAARDFAGESATWWDSNAQEYGTLAKELAPVADDPRYVIEQRAFVPNQTNMGNTNTAPTGRFFYRVIARGEGASTDAVAVLSSAVVLPR